MEQHFEAISSQISNIEKMAGMISQTISLILSHRDNIL